ncbi:MAG TPA: molybdopterin molybdenumtransferase MoeA, partial [Desulfovibrio sp.]|nr:molybdopterin molybdenumtransferase MoeA [Desulfovibrio sp.]
MPDRSDAIAERITALLGENDCVITTGGVGGGDCDLMAGALIRAS